jgi:phosphoglycolate phosphatase
MKTLLLFDIDGTLLRGGPAKGAFQSALLQVFGTTGPIDHWDFSGKTDPQIARELLRAAGLEDARIDRGLPDLWKGYLAGLEDGLRGTPMERLPGVPELLEVLLEMEAEGEVALGLVTGNLARGAELKMASAGLRSTWSVGGFGSDHEERDELPGIALERALGTLGRRFEPREVVVIGDTPRDVACGQAHGLRTLGVATGSFEVESLEASGADAVLQDFTDTEAVVRILLAEDRAA